MRAAARALVAAPDQCGPWRKSEEHKFAPDVEGILNFAGAINRTYVNSETGQSVSVAIFVGPPGPTSTHTAAMCYSSKGYRLLSDTAELTIPGSGNAVNRFRQNLFESESFDKQRLEVCYAWRAGDLWEVPPVPRVAFGNALRLFKIQIAANFEQTDTIKDASVCRDFLQSFLPALDAAVFQQLSE